MKIQILGTGCPKCRKLTANAEQAIQELGLEVEIDKITDLQEIMRFGVMMTPALAVDGAVKAEGKILSAKEIKQTLQDV